MAIIGNKRSIMTLYSDPIDIDCHQVRVVLAEKGVNFEIIDISLYERPEDLAELNPYNSVPTLVDRDLVIFEPNIVMEYLDERFPHPPLMPVYPVARAEHRRMIYRIRRDLYPLMNTIQGDDLTKADQARSILQDTLVGMSPAFSNKPYCMSNEFSLIDCCFATLLWRLPLLDIEISSKAKPLLKYMDRVFERESFQVSLSDTEREIRE